MIKRDTNRYAGAKANINLYIQLKIIQTQIIIKEYQFHFV